MLQIRNKWLKCHGTQLIQHLLVQSFLSFTFFFSFYFCLFSIYIFYFLFFLFLLSFSFYPSLLTPFPFSFFYLFSHQLTKKLFFSIVASEFDQFILFEHKFTLVCVVASTCHVDSVAQVWVVIAVVVRSSGIDWVGELLDG